MKRIITLLVFSISVMLILNCSNNPTGPNIPGDNTVFDGPSKGTTYHLIYWTYPSNAILLEDPENPGTFFVTTEDEFPVFTKCWHTENDPNFALYPGEMILFETQLDLPFGYHVSSGMAPSPNWYVVIMYQDDNSKGSKIKGKYDNDLWEEDTMSHWGYHSYNCYYRPFVEDFEVLFGANYFLLKR